MKKKPALNSLEIPDQPIMIRKANESENASFVQSETRTIILHCGGQRSLLPLKKQYMTS